jgi:hypothetical protein
MRDGLNAPISQWQNKENSRLNNFISIPKPVAIYKNPNLEGPNIKTIRFFLFLTPLNDVAHGHPGEIQMSQPIDPVGVPNWVAD